MMTTENVATAGRASELVRYLESRPRWHLDVDVDGLQNHDGAPVFKIRFWVNSKTDDNEAIAAGYADADRLSKRIAEGAADDCKRDPDFAEDMKTCQALWRACRNPANDEPVFPSPQWIKDSFASHQIAYLLNCYNICKMQAARVPPRFDRERVDAYRDGCVAMFDTALPERMLAPLGREHLTVLTLMTMKAWHEEREALIARVAELEAPAPAAETTGDTH